MKAIHKFLIKFANQSSLSFLFYEQDKTHLIDLIKTTPENTQKMTLTYNELLILFGDITMMMHTKEFSRKLTDKTIQQHSDELQQGAKIYTTYNLEV